jgi:predicted membrane protein
MKKLYFTYICIVICAPFVFLFYLKHDLVCAPRAITASAIFGVVPLSLLTIAIFKKKKNFFYYSLFVLIIEIIITPAIMLKRLGWEEFINERLLAFFTFEGIAIIQTIITISLLLDFLKSQENKADF